MSKAIRDEIQKARIHLDQATILRSFTLLERLNQECERLETLVKQQEIAMGMVGLYRCSITEQFFKMPEDGMILADGRPASWQGLRKFCANLRAPITFNVLDELCARYRIAVIEPVLRDGKSAKAVGNTAEVLRLAEALGWKYPLDQSEPPFSEWLKRNPGRLIDRE